MQTAVRNHPVAAERGEGGPSGLSQNLTHSRSSHPFTSTSQSIISSQNSSETPAHLSPSIQGEWATPVRSVRLTCLQHVPTAPTLVLAPSSPSSCLTGLPASVVLTPPSVVLTASFLKCRSSHVTPWFAFHGSGYLHIKSPQPARHFLPSKPHLSLPS